MAEQTANQSAWCAVSPVDWLRILRDCREYIVQPKGQQPKPPFELQSLMDS